MTPRLTILIVLVGFASAGFAVVAGIPAARPSAGITLALGAIFGVVALRRAIRRTASPRSLLILAMLAAALFAATSVLATDALCLHGYRTADGSCAWE